MQVSTAETQNLLTCFFKECESQFRFLEEKHGYLYLSGLAEYHKNYKIIKPYNGQTPADNQPFFALTRYEQHDQAIEVMYGDNQYILEIFIYPDAVSRLSLRDMIMATRGDSSAVKDLSYLTEPEHVTKSLKWFAQAIIDNPKVIKPSAKLIERASTMRSKLIEHGVRAHLDRLVEDSTTKAAAAFVEKNYAKVIDLLMPYQNFLGSSALKQLRIAQQKLS